MRTSSISQGVAAELERPGRGVWGTLLRGRRVLAGFVGVSVVVGVLLAALLPPFYVAAGSFMPPQSDSSASGLLAQLGGLGALAGLAGAGGGSKNSGDLYVGFLQTQTVEDALIERFGLMGVYHARRMSEARRALQEHTLIDAKSKDGIVRITVTDRSPERAAGLVNGYIEQMRKLSGSLAVSEASQRRLFLGKQMDGAKENLAKAEDALQATEEKTGVVQVEAQARALIETAAALRAQVAAKEVAVASMRTYAGEGNTRLLEAEGELAGLRAKESDLSGKGASLSNLVPGKNQLTGAGLEYLRRYRDVKYQEALYGILARQYETAKLDEAKEGSFVQVVDRGVAPDYRAGPKRLPILLAALVLGLSFGVAWVLIRPYLRAIGVVMGADRGGVRGGLRVPGGRTAGRTGG